MTVSVLIPPKILRDIDAVIWDNSESGFVEDGLVLSCPADGIPRPKISWFKLGIPVAQLHDDVIIADDTLSIPVVKADHAGTFMCVAQNQAGSDHFDVELVVREAPTVQVQSEVEIFQGRSMLLQ